MIKKSLLFTLFVSIMLACGPVTEEEKIDDDDLVALSGDEKKFFDRISSLCGKKFEGRQIYMTEGRENFAGEKMVIHFESCTDEKISIPFHIGKDKSRTWLLLAEDGRLRLRHDHRYEDGTPEEITMYGGFSNPNKSTEFSQYFPPDDYTIELLENAPGHEWAFTLTEDMKTMAYCLQYEEELIFKAEFYTDEPLNK